MTEPLHHPGARDFLAGQFEIAWQLTDYHLTGLTTAEYLWRPGGHGLHVHQAGDGRWVADWPDRESYDIGPPSIAWTTWHIGFWWSMVFDHCFGRGTLTREQVTWPGDAELVRASITGFAQRWRAVLADLTDDELRSSGKTRWPFQDRPFGDLVGWLTVELTKNAAEIGAGRFLYATRIDRPGI